MLDTSEQFIWILLVGQFSFDAQSWASEESWTHRIFGQDVTSMTFANMHVKIYFQQTLAYKKSFKVYKDALRILVDHII